jgi:hypothetical protein
MRVLTAFGLVVLLASLVTCEVRNPDRCLLPDYPCPDGKFCKVTGDMGGVGTCMTAECAYSATYNGTANGCDPATPICTSEGRCMACSSSGQCKSTNPALPICTNPGGAGTCVECMASSDCTSDPARPACNQTTHTCQPCTQHSQCTASQACVKDDTLANLPAGQALTRGTCVPATRVLTVDDSGSPATTLSQQIAAASAAKPYILIKNYKTKAAITVPPIAGLPELHIITTTADQSPAQMLTAPPVALSFQSGMSTTLVVQPGASVTMEGVTIINNITAVLCDSDNSKVSTTTPVPTSLKLIRSIIGSGNTGIVTHPKCQLTVDSSWIGIWPTLASPLVTGNYMAISLNSTQFDITNSVFVHNVGTVGMLNGMFGGISIQDTMNLGPSGHIVNCTFDRHEPSDGMNHNAMAVYCPGVTPFTHVAIFNNVFVNSTPSNGRHYVDPNCINTASTSYGYSATDESPAPSGAGITGIVSTGVSEAMLTSTMGLQTNAPMTVINGGTPTFTNGSDVVNSPTVDMNGAVRNTMHPSMGAFEVAH